MLCREVMYKLLKIISILFLSLDSVYSVDLYQAKEITYNGISYNPCWISDSEFIYLQFENADEIQINYEESKKNTGSYYDIYEKGYNNMYYRNLKNDTIKRLTDFSHHHVKEIKVSKDKTKYAFTVFDASGNRQENQSWFRDKELIIANLQDSTQKTLKKGQINDVYWLTNSTLIFYIGNKIGKLNIDNFVYEEIKIPYKIESNEEFTLGRIHPSPDGRFVAFDYSVFSEVPIEYSLGVINLETKKTHIICKGDPDLGPEFTAWVGKGYTVSFLAHHIDAYELKVRTKNVVTGEESVIELPENSPSFAWLWGKDNKYALLNAWNGFQYAGLILFDIQNKTFMTLQSGNILSVDVSPKEDKIVFDKGEGDIYGSGYNQLKRNIYLMELAF